MKYVNLIWLVLAFPSLAHDPRPVVVDITEISSGSVVLTWRLPPGIEGANQPSLDLSPNCSLKTELPFSKTFQCADPDLPEALGLKYPNYNPSLSTMIRFKPHRFDLRYIHLGPNDHTAPLPIDGTSSNVLTEYFDLGTSHILGGYDHILFVLCMMLLAARWQRIVLVVTGFTLGHSVTLALSSLGYINVAIEPIEALIALSIVFVAAEVARDNRETVTWRFPALVSSIFGLLHGLGFASALQEIGVPEQATFSALFAFNLRVVAGQLLVVGVILSLAWIALKMVPTSLPRLQIPAAYGIGILSSFWLIERLNVL